jgi:hypothetical protein
MAWLAGKLYHDTKFSWAGCAIMSKGLITSSFAFEGNSWDWDLIC